MKDLLLEFLDTILNENRTKAGKEAERLGLKRTGRNLYGPPGEDPTHMSIDGGTKLVPIVDKPSGEEVPAKKAVTKKTPAKKAVTKKTSVKTPRSKGDAAKELAASLEDDPALRYVPKNLRRFRAASLARIGAVLADDTLTKEQKDSARELNEKIRSLLTLHGQGKTKQAKALAQELQNKFKFFSNSTGASFKTMMFGTRHRHVFGKGTVRRNGKAGNLAGDLVDIFTDLGIDLRGQDQGDKVIKNKLSAASKPVLGSPIYGYDRKGPRKKDPITPADPTVQEVFKTLSFIPERFRSLFGPTENGQLVSNENGKNAEIYFRHSIENNTSLERTSAVLRETGMDGMADSIDRHRERMQSVLKNFNRMSPQQREQAVQNSYATMAMELHRPPTGDPELCGSIMKNLAEINLYDQEIAAGKEVYLPADGSFPAADKLVRVKAGTKGERVSGISVKYGKSGKVYGMPAQSSTITLWHPDSFYHDITTVRPGSEGYALGVRDDCLERSNWNKLMQGAGYGTALSGREQDSLRVACTAAADYINRKRGKDANNIKIRTTFGQAENSQEAKRIHEILFGKPEDAKKIQRMIDIFGKERVQLLRNNPLAFAAMLAADAAIVTGKGFPDLYHCHQEISQVERGGDVKFDQAVEGARADLGCWHYMWRATDERGGGILMGYNCGDHT